MTTISQHSELVQIKLGEELTAANGAPQHEPEVWDEGVAEFNPLFSHVPESAPLAISAELAARGASGHFDMAEFLREEGAKDLLRFSTAGSVDDGKSTLIGRLLYDTESVYDDQVRSIEGKGTTGAGQLDLALLTDGLRAEREQGITIDVAYRYFSTRRRKFIIADTPGHEQYTRNMATGASTASLAIVLVDARKGVLIQSRRHACITALLGVRHMLIAVNKMDLVGYDEQVFEQIRAEFTAFFDELGALRPPHLYFVPVSALKGDNVVRASAAMPWYTGSTLLGLLESVPAAEAGTSDPFRFTVQRVLRPTHDFRGFAGQIAAGSIHPGDEIMVLPSRSTSRVRSIVTFGGDLAAARAPQSVVLTLEDELDVSRGDLLAAPETPAIVSTQFTASLVWMDEQPLDLSRRYLLKHTTRVVQANVVRVEHRLDVATLEHQPARTLNLNEIGLVEIETVQPLTLDRYATNRVTGSFILIDAVTNATAAAGMIREATLLRAEPDKLASAPVTADERAARWGHIGAHVHLTGSHDFADAAERALFGRGAFAIRLLQPTNAALEVLVAAGALVITHEASQETSVTLGREPAAITDLDDLLRLLKSRSILKGDLAR